MNINHYVTKSLELHLFFGRIMKEHALFLQAGFTPACPDFSEKADRFLEEFEALLSDVVRLSDGIAGRKVLTSGEVVTEYTALAERQTASLTGIPINHELTGRTLRLTPRGTQSMNLSHMQRHVRRLNRRALKLLNELIEFKETILKCVSQGQMFTMNYPLLIEHILREAKLYRRYVQTLEQQGYLPDQMVKENERFWNQIMMEHAQFIRGLLDPCETELMDTADHFAKEFCKLLNASKEAHDKTMNAKTLEQTTKFRDFKAAGTKGIQQCKIRSVILPLLADHVLREANHYIRLLEP